MSGFGVVLALMAATIFFGVDLLDSMNHDVMAHERTADEKTHQVFTMREAIRKRSFSLVLTSTLDDFFDRDAERERFHGYERQYIIARENLKALGLTDAEAERLDEVQARLRQAREPVDMAMDIAVERRDRDSVWQAIQSAVTAQRELIDRLNGLVSLIQRGSEKHARESMEAYERVRDAARNFGVVILLAGLAIAGFVIIRETRQTRELVDEISVRERAEANARDLSALLENKVRERTAELSKAVDALRAARDEAQSANLTKSQFLATMSHELRTPLNAIIGFSDAIDREIFGPVVNTHYKAYIADINQSGRHLLELINDILDISVIESGKLELVLAPLSAATLADTSVRLVRPAADKTGVVLQATATDDLPAVLADERRAKQILVNLLANAVKFTPPGGLVSLDVAAVPDRGSVSFTIRDTGIGMSGTELEKALRKFGQVDSDLARKYEGTGLGLPLARELTELHNGTFGVESTPGRGTVVTVTLPARPEPGLRVVSEG